MFTTLFWIGLTLTVLGTGASVAGSIYNNKPEEERQREQAEQSKKEAEFQRDTQLGTMERQLVQNMGSDYESAQDIEAARNASAISASQSTYVSQLAAEEQFSTGLAQNAQSMGDLERSMGASGAKEDTTLATIVQNEMNASASVQRQNIDKTMGLSAYQLQENARQSKTQQARLEGKYQPGSAVMNLYNYQRQRINEGTTLETTYLDSVIEDNSDYLSWSNWWGSDAMWGDVLTAGAGMVDIGNWVIGNWAGGSSGGSSSANVKASN